MKKSFVILLSIMLLFSVAGCGDKKQDLSSGNKDNGNNITTIDSKIKEIGDVTLNSDSKITEVEEMVNKLSDDDKSKLNNLQQLEEARVTLDALKVDDEINKIQEVTLEKADLIKNARSLYDSSSDKVKNKVTNLKVLEDSENKLKDLKDKVGKAALAKLKSSYDKVEGITWYNSKAEPKYADTRSFVLPYIGKNSSGVWLRLIFHYTGDDWVFFKKVTISIDGEKHVKTFSYYDVERDNEYGNVWEWVDFEPSESDISMLKAIASSKETIVRFEGDAKHYDLTVKASDKTAITDVLNAYEAIK